MSRRLPRKFCVRRYNPIANIGEFLDHETTLIFIDHTAFKRKGKEISDLIRTNVYPKIILLGPLSRGVKSEFTGAWPRILCKSRKWVRKKKEDDNILTMRLDD